MDGLRAYVLFRSIRIRSACARFFDQVTNQVPHSHRNSIACRNAPDRNLSFLERLPRGIGLRALWSNMNTTSEPKRTKRKAAARPHPNMKNATGTAMRRAQFRKPKTSGSQQLPTKAPQNAQRNYDRYLELARAEAISGDRVAAENYLQHAEHYLRSMRESRARPPQATKSDR
jgi:hypothetical protein